MKREIRFCPFCRSSLEEEVHLHSGKEYKICANCLTAMLKEMTNVYDITYQKLIEVMT